jgi:SAM-dependent methyltransferase
MAEALRVLKPGGCAIVTVPLFWHLHEEPRDFFRYTKHGLRHVLEEAGFEVLSVTALSGFCVTFAQELCYFLQRFGSTRAWDPRKWIVRGLCHAIQGMAFVVHPLERNESFTVEYIAVARRPVLAARDRSQLRFAWGETARRAA